jgi:hypothetical protein
MPQQRMQSSSPQGRLTRQAWNYRTQSTTQFVTDGQVSSYPTQSIPQFVTDALNVELTNSYHCIARDRRIKCGTILLRASYISWQMHEVWNCPTQSIPQFVALVKYGTTQLIASHSSWHASSVELPNSEHPTVRENLLPESCILAYEVVPLC